ncbi:MAG: hypothetical protein ACOC44_06860 [Promethearchaeia archaeon]
MEKLKLIKILLLVILIFCASFVTIILVIGVPPTSEDPVSEFPHKRD